MVQSWENFMDPSGGYRRNDYVDGTASMAVPLITEAVLLPFVLPRAEMLEMREARAKIRSNVSSQVAATKPKGGYSVRGPHGGYVSAESMWQRNYKETYGRARKAGDAKFQQKKASIARKYAGLKSSARAIGWGYLALMGVEMGAAFLSPTPGVVKSAMENDARAMGYNTLSDSSQAYTQRQRALMAIHDSQLGIRNVIGAEAPHLHR